MPVRPSEPGTETRRRWPRRLLVAAALLVVLDQLALHLLLGDGELLGRRVAPYDPPIFNEGQERELGWLREHLETGEPTAERMGYDAELGWCPPRAIEYGGHVFDAAGTRVGTRPLTVARRPGLRRIVAVGCSFTFGQEVADDESWAAQLELLRADLELANLGVGAYGIDQALLRYVRDGRPLAGDEVWLGLFPSAALRVTTLYRPAQRHWAFIARFKPRFVLEAGGELRLVPNPAPSPAEAYALLTHQDRFFEALRRDDAWVARCPAAWMPEGSHPVHHSALGRAVLTALEVQGRDRLAGLREPSSEVHRLVRALVLRLRDEAEADGARFRLLILPGPAELAEVTAGGDTSWSALCAELAREGVEVLDPSAAMAARLADHPGTLFAQGQHYDAEGNRWMAGWLAAHVGAPEGER
jgi:hypothetical protein